MSENNFNPAFPCTLTVGETIIEHLGPSCGGISRKPVTEDFEGITKREYFAAKAMQGELSHANREWSEANIADLAEWSYSVADAMIKAGDNR